MAQQTNVGVGATIRARREALGLSREGLAYKADLNIRTIERIEAGTVEPHRATRNMIEAALGREESDRGREPVAAA